MNIEQLMALATETKQGQKNVLVRTAIISFLAFESKEKLFVEDICNKLNISPKTYYRTRQKAEEYCNYCLFQRCLRFIRENQDLLLEQFID